MGLVYLSAWRSWSSSAICSAVRARRPRGRADPLHSLPDLSWRFRRVTVAGADAAALRHWLPVADWIVETRRSRLLILPSPTIRCAAAPCCAISRPSPSGRYSGEPTPALRRAAETYVSVRSLPNNLILASGLVLGLLGLAFGLRALRLSSAHARRRARRQGVLFAAACVAVLTTVGIVLSVLFETVRFFEKVSPIDFLFGMQWSPQTAIRADQVGSSGAFGIVPLVTGTLLITLIAMLVAGPVGLFAAIYMAEYATPAVPQPLPSRSSRSSPASRPWCSASSPP